MNVQQTIRKWGNSSGVRLPQTVLKAANLQLNQSLNISIQGNSVMLTPVQTVDAISLRKMLAGVSPADVGAKRYE